MADVAITKEPTFPYPNSKDRLTQYNYYENLFMGDHFTAFNIAIDNNKDFNRAYAKLRYIKANFAGLVSKIIADMLFSEPISIDMGEDGDQDWMDAFIHDNQLNTILYESALSNSYMGDAGFKLRLGQRMAGDKENSVILSNIPPSIYFPTIDSSNIDQDPEIKELAWVLNTIDPTGKPKKYLRKEIHTPGLITNEIYLMEGDVIKGKTTFAAAGFPNVVDSEKTLIDRQLVLFFPNWKTVTRFWGISDYYDLDTLFFAINNRLSKIDGILDKHSDPLLLVPPGILDERGQVKRGNLGVIEVKNPEDGKPEYVVWDASLDNAFKEIDSLVENMMMVSETSPDILGMGKGQADSGKALKLKLLRTIAKATRKKLYYDHSIKEILYRAQLFAKAWNVKAGGLPLTKEPVMPEIIWADGLPVDDDQLITNEISKIDAGIESQVDAIAMIDGIDKDSAQKKLDRIKEEKAVSIPVSNIAGGNPFDAVQALKDKANGMMNNGKGLMGGK